MSNSTCLIEGCCTQAEKAGLCGKHYQKKRVSAAPPCAIEGCKNLRAIVANGYCSTHHRRLLKHGDPNVTMKGKAHKVQYTEDGLRVCKVCGEAKPDDEYHLDKYGTGGRRSKCKVCAGRAEKARYEKDPARRRATSNAWRAANLEYARAWDMMRYERDKDKRIELATEASHLRRARMRVVESEPGVNRASLRARDGDDCCYFGVSMDFNRAVGRVFFDHHATVEHIVPISRGGGHIMSNCKLACRKCNLTKNARSLDEWQRAGDNLREVRHG